MAEMVSPVARIAVGKRGTRPVSRNVTTTGYASANAEAALVRALFAKDENLSDYYNNVLASGKWHHMMDQPHIGYTGWAPPNRNIMPKVTEVTLPDTADFGVAVDGSALAWPSSNGAPALPAFDSLNPQRSYVDVFARGSKPIEFQANADQPWIVLKEDKAPGAGDDRRVWVNVDWSKAPVGQTQGAVTINGGTNSVTVKLTAHKATAEAPAREHSRLISPRCNCFEVK